MAFFRWVRQNSEHYLMIDAQRKMAKKYGLALPPRSRRWRERFWLDVFAPVYRRLPWKVRQRTIHMMPGSHRQTWTAPSRRGLPAIGGSGSPPAMSQQGVAQPVAPSRGE
jgi:hypothetical protein